MVLRRNLQSSSNFNVIIPRLKNAAYFIQDVTLPGLSSSSANAANQFKSIPFTPDRLEFGNLEVSIRMQEGMRAWFEVFQWMIGITFPNKHEQYYRLHTNNIPEIERPAAKELNNSNLYDQIVLMILDSNYQPYLEITFKDAYTISMSDLTFTSQDDKNETMTFNVTFTYDYYRVTELVYNDD